MVENKKNEKSLKKPILRRNNKIKNDLRSSFININAEWVNTKDLSSSKKNYNYVDLFSGAGGISCGFEMVGLNSILGVEIDEIASETYHNNFPNAKQYVGNIKDLSNDEILNLVGNNEVHIVTGGFPCQGFSVAGFRDSDDERNVLYKEVVRVVQTLQPWFVVLENVPGILSMQKGKVFKTIINDFDSIGYPNMSVHILEAADYGVAQLRPRAIFIANRFGVKNPFPKPQLKPEEYVSIEDAINDLKDMPRNPEFNHEWTKHTQKTIERISKVCPGESLYDHFADAYKRQYKGYPSMTIKENHGGTHIHHELNRCISAREMARLQSFPDDFVFAGTMKKAMWQIGNAVAPVMFKNIGLALSTKLDEIDEKKLSNN